jgi:hypothetical protein
MSSIERPIPPMNAGERETLESWLDFHRATLLMKCDGLADEQASAAAVPPSGLTMTGLVQHLAEVERNWFVRVFTGKRAPSIYTPDADLNGPDGGFDLAADAGLQDAIVIWEAEVTRSRAVCAAHELSDTGRFMGQEVSLRWIYVHMIEEYARHYGHADLLRECVDGAVGA